MVGNRNEKWKFVNNISLGETINDFISGPVLPVSNHLLFNAHF